MVRRLPVIQASDSDERPRWHWFLIGTGFTVTLWLPLALLGLWSGSLLQRLAYGVEAEPVQTALVRAAPLLFSFFLACFASSALLGRFGGEAGVREALLGNLAATALILAIGGVSGDLGAGILLGALLVLTPCAVLAGWGGVKLGRRLRQKNP